MKITGMDTKPPGELRPPLRKLTDEVRKECTSCDICLRDCAFLRKYGNPGRIADAYNPSDKESMALPFECSLCGLCASVCPERLNLTALFLEMRREAVDRGGGGFPEHAVITNYEKTGVSRRFTLYRLPEGCDTIFFPGCALAGTRPDGVRKVFDSLQRTIPHLGIVFDCCMKPSHDLGREAYFTAMFNEMRDYLVGQGVKTVLTACPNCQLMFGTYGDGLTTSTIYEALSASHIPVNRVSGTVTIHDPCSIRGYGEVHAAVRDLLGRIGLTIEEMPHSGDASICCGEGGAVAFLAPELAEEWRNLRHSEADGRKMVTYCAACTAVLGKRGSCSHVIDILFDAENALAGKAKVSKAPFTYLNRLLLKREFKRKEGAALLRERTFAAGDETRKSGIKPLILVVFLVAAIVAVHFFGASRYLDKDWVEGDLPLTPGNPPLPPFFKVG
jgi:Fe-S oxidoreductase